MVSGCLRTPVPCRRQGGAQRWKLWAPGSDQDQGRNGLSLSLSLICISQAVFALTILLMLDIVWLISYGVRLEESQLAVLSASIVLILLIVTPAIILSKTVPLAQ